MNDLLLFALVGKLSLYYLQHFPPAEYLAQRLGQEEFYSCDLCLGVWVFFGFAILVDFTVITTLHIWIDYFLTGAIMSFLMHLISLGWEAKFSIMVID